MTYVRYAEEGGKKRYLEPGHETLRLLTREQYEGGKPTRKGKFIPERSRWFKPSPNPIPEGARGTEAIPKLTRQMKRHTDATIKRMKKSKPVGGSGNEIRGVDRKKLQSVGSATPKKTQSLKQAIAPKPKSKGINGGVTSTLRGNSGSVLKWIGIIDVH